MDRYETVYYRRHDGKWDVRVKSVNGNTLLNSDQGYENFSDCRQMVISVLDSEVASNFSIDTTAFDNRGETV